MSDPIPQANNQEIVVKIDVYRIKRVVKYEYTTTELVDTSEFPECENLTLPERLAWCVNNPDKVWGGDFEEFVHGYEYSHDREIEDGVFVYASPQGTDEWSNAWDDKAGELKEVGSGTGKLSNKYP